MIKMESWNIGENGIMGMEAVTHRGGCERTLFHYSGIPSFLR
jgi:hypothetical protein